MEEKYEIIEDDLDDIEVEKEETHTMNEMIYIENQKEADLNQSKTTQSKKSKLSASSEKKLSLGGQNSVMNKIKSGNTSLMNKSIGVTSLNTTKKSVSINLKKNASNLSFGERLYRKAIALKEMKNKKTLEEKISKEIQNKRECSFAPKVNEDSCLKNLKRTYDRSVDSSFATAKKKEIESYIKKKEEQELAELK